MSFEQDIERYKSMGSKTKTEYDFDNYLSSIGKTKEDYPISLDARADAMDKASSVSNVRPFDPKTESTDTFSSFLKPTEVGKFNRNELIDMPINTWGLS